MSLSDLFKTLAFSITVTISINSASALASEDPRNLSPEQFKQQLVRLIEEENSNFDMEQLERELLALVDEDDEENVVSEENLVSSESFSSSEPEEEDTASMTLLKQELFTLLDEEEASSRESSSSSTKVESTKEETPKTCEDEYAKICSEITPVQPTPTIQFNVVNNFQNILTNNNYIININYASYKYKTELCRNFANTGCCSYGPDCQFAHGQNDLRERRQHPFFKTQRCKSYSTTGSCRYESRCSFLHI